MVGLNKPFFITIYSLFHFALLSHSQNKFDVRLHLDSVNCVELQVCYAVQLRSSSGQSWNVAGQNYRLYYDGSLASFQSGYSLLPNTYQGFTLVQDIQNVDASATNGVLSFESSLSFLNYTMDLNDIINGGINLPANGDWLTTSQLCFTVSSSLLDSPDVCLEAVWAREGLTNEYATSFVQVSEWTTSNNTQAASGDFYDDLDTSDGAVSCLTGYCAFPDTIFALLGDTCLDANVYELLDVKRSEVLQASTNISLSLTDTCVRVLLTDPTYFGLDTASILMCDTLLGIEVCDTTIIVVTIPPPVDTCPNAPFISLISASVCEQEFVELEATQYPDMDVVYNWTKDGVSIPNSNAFKLVLDTANIADAGNYEVTIRVDRCTLTSPMQSLEVFEKPVLSVAPVPPITCVTGQEDLRLDAIVVGGLGAFQYEWIGPNEFYSVNEDPVLINLNETMDGSYTVFATNMHGCSPDPFTIEIDITEGIQEPIITSSTLLVKGKKFN